MTNYQFLVTFECFFAFLLVVFMCIDFFQHVVKKQEMTEGILSKNAITIPLVGVILAVCNIAIADHIGLYIFCMFLNLLCFGLALFSRLRPLKERKNLFRCMKILHNHNKELGLQIEAILERFYFIKASEKDICIVLELQTLFNQKKMSPETLVKEVQRILNKEF